MDAAIFRDEPMGLRERLLAIPLPRRFTYDAEQNILFINFERLSIRTRQDIEDVRVEVERQLVDSRPQGLRDRQLRQLRRSRRS